METKQQLRARMRQIRAAIPDHHERTASIAAAVLGRCADLGAATVMAFVGVGSEPDTNVLLDGLVSAGHRVVLPRVEGDTMVAAEATPQAALVPGRFGIPEPSGVAIDPSLIDVVLVPGLAFTSDGRRLGQGGGFYDRFLPLLREGCVTIGVCFVEQILDDLTTEPHDRIVDVVITDAVAE